MAKRDFLPIVNARNIVIKILILNIVIYMCLGLILPSYTQATQTKYPYTKGVLDKYPGYENLINILQAKHPNWKFTVLETGLDWNEVIKNETVASHGRNLIYYTNTGNWVCSTCGDRLYDSGRWKCASESAVAYYMDPRNWINEANVFQFENLGYNGDIQNIQGVNKILSTVPWAKGDKITYIKTDGTTGTLNKSYAQVIMEAAKEAGISPYHLAARIKQEQGVNNTASSTGRGDNATYKGYYNFLNIKATGGDIIGNALKHAKSEGWDNPEKSIIGGAKFIASSYISRGQSTLYLQKFDVDSSDGSLYYHQYMQNVSAALSEGNTVRTSYEGMGLLDSSINFVIPVYNNMPLEAAPSPAGFSIVTQNVKVTGNSVAVREGKGTSTTEITKVNTGDILLRIEVSGTKEQGYYWDRVVLPDGRKGYIARDYITQIDDVSNVNLNAVANVNVNLRNGPGTVGTRVMTTITSGQSVTVIETGKYNGLDGYNWSRVKLGNGTQGYLVSEYLSEVAKTNYIIAYVNCNPDGKVNVRSGVGTNHSVVTSVRKDNKVTVLQKAAGEANGYTWDKIVTTDGLEGFIANEYLRYEEAKQPEENNNKQPVNNGDVNKNGELDPSDYVLIKNHIMGKTTLSAEQIKIGDMNENGELDPADYILIKNKIMR
ncbi:MAG: SH3 domain-containing protein [Clostridia bacterium]|nr:SH3 domain-containing protein [Clostridia bacterium]